MEQFVDPPDYDVICTICQGVLRCPVRSACHHIFCKKCILQWLKRSSILYICSLLQIYFNLSFNLKMKTKCMFILCRQETCPCCRKPVNPSLIFAMFKLSKSIGRMKIKVGNITRYLHCNKESKVKLSINIYKYSRIIALFFLHSLLL